MFQLLLTLALFSFTTADNWAVLVAGSSYYYNYRHQADICHAFQILKSMGFPDDRVIVMMADDIVNNSANPFPGTVINWPNGTNLYPGVNHDYTGHRVTPENFLNVLRGKASQPGDKVLKSNSSDNIFVYFADHGAPGLVAFPYDGQVLYAYQLIETLRYMHDNRLYKKMVIYIEACESGSMFNKLLPSDWNIYAVTAATPFQSSYACYCGDNNRNTCLGDVFSVNWLENAEPRHIRTETLFDQFLVNRVETKTSVVCQYGNISMNREFLASYLSYGEEERSGGRFKNGKAQFARSTSEDILSSRLVRSDDVTYYFDWLDKNDPIKYDLVYDQYVEELDWFKKHYPKTEDTSEEKGCYGSEIDSRCIEKALVGLRHDLSRPLSEAGLTLVKEYLSEHCIRV